MRKGQASPTAPAGAARPRLSRKLCLRTRIDRELTRPMVWLALVFVLVMALALPHAVITVTTDEGAAEGAVLDDQSPVGATAAESAPATSGPILAFRPGSERLAFLNHLAVAALVLLAIPFWLEAIVRLAFIERGPRDTCRVPRPSRGRAAYILCCAIVPPLRTGLHPATMRGHMWLPIFGWRRTSGRLARHVQKAFGLPMLCIGLLILPVLVLEIFFSREIRTNPGLALGLDVATRLIWFAFALEFILMMAVTPRRTEYAFRHWVDLVIILLPFVAFLRSLQVLRAGQLLKAQRMSQFARVYRLRGLSVKLLQAVLMLRVLEGLSERAARRRIHSLRGQIHRREGEIQELHEELRDLRREFARRIRRKRRLRKRTIAVAPAPSPEPETVTPAAG